VVGGGINGAAVARDAAMRGLRVALIDQGDFAGATSSHSSKLIHGGLRYLPQGQLSLVYHALRERERLRHITAPHLVHPIRFLYPVYGTRGVRRFALSAGLMLYDLFARPPVAERHRRLTPAAIRELEPTLAPDNLAGGAAYYDAWGDDARLTLENVLDAAAHGAAIANYLSLEGFERIGERLAVARVHDLESGQSSFELRARLFVNAAGSQVDEVRRMDDPGCAPSVRLTKGVHLVFDGARLPVSNSLVLSDDDGRIVFAMPRDGYVLVGTTDTDFAGNARKVAVEESDIAYLLSVLAQSLSGVRLTPDDVVYSFAGLRTLIVGDGKARPSSVSREEVIVESPSGLLSVAGGKLTTHRRIAEKVVDKLMRLLRRDVVRCPTHDTPLIGARPCGESEPKVDLSPAVRRNLAARYGTRAALVVEVVHERPELAAELAPNAPAIAAEVVYAVRHEMARTVADFLVRRTSMVWRTPRAASAAVAPTARIMAEELGWDSSRVQTEIDAFYRFSGLLER
jgi:glycerol-3-phosphate dehydrogenase